MSKLGVQNMAQFCALSSKCLLNQTPELGQEEEGRQRNSRDWIRPEPRPGADKRRGGCLGRYA